GAGGNGRCGSGRGCRWSTEDVHKGLQPATDFGTGRDSVRWREMGRRTAFYNATRHQASRPDSAPSLGEGTFSSFGIQALSATTETTSNQWSRYQCMHMWPPGHAAHTPWMPCDRDVGKRGHPQCRYQSLPNLWRPLQICTFKASALGSRRGDGGVTLLQIKLQVATEFAMPCFRFSYAKSTSRSNTLVFAIDTGQGIRRTTLPGRSGCTVR
ncbi:hypothetical protein EJ04DRAFT_596154, partial [Polyplosphaeria fusca]